MPLVKVPVRPSSVLRTSLSIRMPVSSLCSTPPCAANRISSSSRDLIGFAAAFLLDSSLNFGNCRSETDILNVMGRYFLRMVEMVKAERARNLR